MIVWREKEKGSEGRKLTRREKVVAFYHAPATKFWANVVRDDCFLFVCLFLFFLLDKILYKVLDNL